MGIHHAGMLRGDRKLTEQMFYDGAITVLCCTATLAWGVNLPAHTVVIKGTDVYNPEKGGNVDLSIIDVQQIFGRAGRPQFDSSGEATLITTLEAFPRYMDKLVRPVAIESNFAKHLADHLNAEIVGRAVTNIEEGATWLTYTYMYVRMLQNPLAYGISADEYDNDPKLRQRCKSLIMEAAKLLNTNQMIRYHWESGNLGVREHGRIAAHFYIQAESIATFNELFRDKDTPIDLQLFRAVCSAHEFQQMKLRPDEMDELQDLGSSNCPLKMVGVGGDQSGRVLITDSTDKALVLLQCIISRARVKSFTLITDTNYINANAARIVRALFEMKLKEGNSWPALKLLRIAKSIEKQLWWFQTPLRQFESELGKQVYESIESNGKDNTCWDIFETTLSLLDLQVNEVEAMCKAKGHGRNIQQHISMLPRFEVTGQIHPVTRHVLKFEITIEPLFQWAKRWHGSAQSFWLLVEDPSCHKIYHHEYITLSFRTYEETLHLHTFIPTFDTLPAQYMIHMISDNWVGVEQVFPVSLLGTYTLFFTLSNCFRTTANFAFTFAFLRREQMPNSPKLCTLKHRFWILPLFRYLPYKTHTTNNCMRNLMRSIR